MERLTFLVATDGSPRNLKAGLGVLWLMAFLAISAATAAQPLERNPRSVDPVLRHLPLDREQVRPEEAPNLEVLTAPGKQIVVLHVPHEKPEEPPSAGTSIMPVAGEPRAAPSGVALTELITVKVRDTVFRVPAAYFTICPTPEMVSTVNVHDDALSFIFWVPELRPVLTKTFPPLLTPRPRELERPPARPDEFAALVLYLQFVRVDDPSYISPAKRFDNYARGFSGAGDVFEQRYGLEWFRLEKEPWKADNYRHVPGTDPQVELGCAENPETLPNPQCHGHVYFSADELAFYVRFSQHEMPRWREVIIGARELALRWRVVPGKAMPPK